MRIAHIYEIFLNMDSS